MSVEDPLIVEVILNYIIIRPFLPFYNGTERYMESIIWLFQLALLVCLLLPVVKELGNKVDISHLHDHFLMTEETIFDHISAVLEHPTVSELTGATNHHVTRYEEVSADINTWFIGACVFVIEVLEVFLRFSEVHTEQGESTPSRVHNFISKKIPVVSSLFVILGAMYFLLEDLPLLKQFQVHCLGNDKTSWTSIVLSYLASFTFSRELFFWGSMKMLIIIGVPQEIALGSKHFAYVVIALLVLSHSFELMAWFLPQLWQEDFICSKPYQVDVGFSDIIFGLIYIEQIFCLRKIHKVTDDDNRPSSRKWIDYMILTVVDVILMCVSPTWPTGIFILGGFVFLLLLSVVFSYDRKVKWGPHTSMQQSNDYKLPSYLVAPAIVVSCMHPLVVPITVGAITINVMFGLESNWVDYCFPLAVLNIFDMFMWQGLIRGLRSIEDKTRNNSQEEGDDWKKDERGVDITTDFIPVIILIDNIRAIFWEIKKPVIGEQTDSQKAKGNGLFAPFFNTLFQVVIPFFVIRSITGGSNSGHMSGVAAALIVVITIMTVGWLPEDRTTSQKSAIKGSQLLATYQEVGAGRGEPAMKSQSRDDSKYVNPTSAADVMSAVESPIVRGGGYGGGLSSPLSPTHSVNVLKLLSEIQELIKTMGKTSNDIETCFRKFDTDGSGGISKDEFIQAMDSLGVTMGKSEVDAVYAHYDDDQSGTLEIEEFKSLVLTPGSKSLDGELNDVAESSNNGDEGKTTSGDRGPAVENPIVPESVSEFAAAEQGGTAESKT